MNQKIDHLLNSLGFGFPETPEQIDLFNEVYKDYEFRADPSRIDPVKILASVRQKPVEITRIDYHKRTVLAAEIVHELHQEWSLGHVKLQKLIYLCQNTTDMAIHTNFLKQAMGPYDPKLMRSIDAQFKRNEWFEFRRDSSQKYWPLGKAGGHKEWYERYFSKQREEIQTLIDDFRTMKTSKVELIGTIYACWKEIIEEEDEFSVESLVPKFYGWSDHKQKYKLDEIRDSISWMLDYGLYPTG